MQFTPAQIKDLKLTAIKYAITSIERQLESKKTRQIYKETYEQELTYLKEWLKELEKEKDK